MYDDPYGYGYGSYGGMSAAYYGGYGYQPYRYGDDDAGYDPFGWYGDDYDPGIGIYAYDSGRHRHVWNGTQRRYRSHRTMGWLNRSGAAGRSEK